MILAKQSQELAQRMVSMCSKIHDFGKQDLAERISKLESDVAEFEALIITEPYASIYNANIETGSTLVDIKAAIVKLKAIQTEWNATYSEIINHIEE